MESLPANPRGKKTNNMVALENNLTMNEDEVGVSSCHYEVIKKLFIGCYDATMLIHVVTMLLL